MRDRAMKPDYGKIQQLEWELGFEERPAPPARPTRPPYLDAIFKDLWMAPACETAARRELQELGVGTGA